MVATMTDRPASARKIEFRCTPCNGRYVGEVRSGARGSAPPDEPEYVRLKCGGCGCWRWFNVATGEMTNRPLLNVA